MPALRSILATAIRAERNRAGLTQGQVTARIGWTRSTLAKVESGSRAVPVDEVPDLCRALGTTLDRLLIDASPADRAAFGLS